MSDDPSAAIVRFPPTDDLGASKIVTTDFDVENETRWGEWRVAAVIVEPQGTGCAAETKYLLTHNKDQTLESCRDKINNLQSELNHANQRAGEAEGKASKAEEKAKEAIEKAEVIEADLATRKKGDNAALEQAKKRATAATKNALGYRKQLGEVWLKLGDDQMKSILGEDTKCPVELRVPKTVHERIMEDDE